MAGTVETNRKVFTMGGSAPWIYLWKMVDVLGGGGGKRGPIGVDLHPGFISGRWNE
jgi:hypothetical protein